MANATRPGLDTRGPSPTVTLQPPYVNQRACSALGCAGARRKGGGISTQEPENLMGSCKELPRVVSGLCVSKTAVFG